MCQLCIICWLNSSSHMALQSQVKCQRWSQAKATTLHRGETKQFGDHCSAVIRLINETESLKNPAQLGKTEKVLRIIARQCSAISTLQHRIAVAIYRAALHGLPSWRQQSLQTCLWEHTITGLIPSLHQHGNESHNLLNMMQCSIKVHECKLSVLGSNQCVWWVHLGGDFINIGRA